MKTCTKCKETKPYSEFSINRSNKDGYQTQCKACRRDHGRKYYSNNKVSIKALRTPEKRREWNLRHKYGITVDEYNKMLEDQDGKCRICNTPLEKPMVDHNHETGEVRGLLCGNCNSMIGMARDDINILARAILYLRIEDYDRRVNECITANTESR
jgi:hypothetical protein